MTLMALSVIVPVYNEVQTITEVLARVHETGLADEIIVVDNGSTDGTWRVLHPLIGDPQLRVICHTANRGKGRRLSILSLRRSRRRRKQSQKYKTK
jgi:glycosyltransferase involved in cell wall biosynthesis